MKKIDLSPVRKQFPALQKIVNGKKRIFFDGGGGTQVPQVVLDAMAAYMVDSNANYSGLFKTSLETEKMLVDIRKDVADFLNAPSWEEIILGPNMTTLTYTILWALSRDLKPGDEVVVSRLDHGANIDPWTALREKGVVVKYIEIDPEDCTLDYDMANDLITSKTRLVAVGLASNAVGTINDAQRLAEFAHNVGALIYVDAVHYAPHFPIDVQELDCDFLVFSGYKCFGPHVGFLWGRMEHLRELDPYRPWPSVDKVPQKYNLGTPNMEGFAGARAAFGYLAEIGEQYGREFRSKFPGFTGKRLNLKTGMEAIAEYELGLSRIMNEELGEMENVHVYGITDPERLTQRCPTYSFTLEGMTSAEICRRMSDEDIYVWNGEDGLGAMELVDYLDVVRIGGLLRVSIEHYNTEDEVYRFIEVLDSLSR